MLQPPHLALAGLLLLVAPQLIAADGYGSGIAKQTYSATDPITCHNWFARYLPVGCQDTMACNNSISCGMAGRVRLCGSDELDADNKCAAATGRPGTGYFGLHTVNTCLLYTSPSPRDS
eukprot:TRINITY_DN51602_c0_g1_i1.p1 TRINITY_DN51602_c0_g1~~TRINITY_DN51602_c0_g1_i1.p1  ORF type:complete len:119 (-),score=19.04 TRINITY_DN51602_c0_g1_i1:64-420(-)